MKKDKKHYKTEEISFWQSSSDLLTALLLVLLLIIVLLILYLMQIPNRKYIGYFDDVAMTESIDEGDETEAEDHDEDHDGGHVTHNGRGGGDGDGDDEGDEPETEGGEYPYEDDGIKSAVYVKLVDGETKNLVKEEGVTFNLHDGSSSVLQILNTYYPTKVSYREFATNADGTFYLPEKVYEKRYFFHALSEPEGYDKAEDYYFEIDNERLYDWPEPYVVEIPVFPSQNTIKIQMNDSITGEAVSGGEFEVVASKDVVTTDGTLRYEKGEVVDHIVCNEEGFGESKKLYLGEYTIRETEIPEYYANVKGILPETVVKQTDEEEEPEIINNERTQIVLSVKDKLTQDPIEDATYTVYDGVEEKEYTTNAEGQITIDEVIKDSTYTLKNTSAPEDYRVSKERLTVKVGQNGRIASKAVYELNDDLTMIRVTFELKDKILQSGIADKTVYLYTKAGKQVDNWVSNGALRQIVGLEPGDYYLTVGKDKKTHYDFVVDDTEVMQPVVVKQWTVIGIAVLIGGIAVGIAILWFIWWLLRRLLKKKSAD